MTDLDAAIHIFDPNTDAGAIPARHYPPLKAISGGETVSFVLDALCDRRADLNKKDFKVAQMTRKRMHACILKLRQRGDVPGVPIDRKSKG